MSAAARYIDRVRSTGRWDVPRLWKDPKYLAASPWTQSELREAFDTLQAIYPPDVVIQAFRDAEECGEPLPWLWRIIGDPFRPDLSAKLALGFDATHAQIRRYPELVERLRRREDYPGARLELSLLAALERQQFEYEYEPYASAPATGRNRPKNPDFRINFGEWITAEAKQLIASQRSQRALNRFFTIMHGRNGLDPVEASVRLRPRYTALEQSVASQDRLDNFAAKLHDHLVKRVSWMRAKGVSSWNMAGIAEISLDAGHHRGGALDDTRDAQRVIGRLAEGAGQIPNDDLGILFVRPSESEPLAAVIHAATQWLRGPEDHIVGVVVIADHYVPNARHFAQVLWPLWRDSAPRRLQRRWPWERLTYGLNWGWLRAFSVWERHG